MIILWINFLWQPWPLSWNPLFDFLFTRSGGPLLYANHVSSEIALLIPTTYFGLKTKSPKLIIVILSTCSIHELVIALNNFATGYYEFDAKYLGELAVFLAIALILASRPQRSTLGKVLVVTMILQALWTMAIYNFGLNTLTIIGFSRGPAFFDWRENLIEIASWILPSSVWFLWK